MFCYIDGKDSLVL